jgi:diaminohydroxyphosphoribosylaminopyrimidine deaminase / 5-amino-6-(5-phosphoribosylamino)uracil reductase
VRLDLLTAASINGLITESRGENGDGMAVLLDTPREVWERKWALRRRHGAVLVGTGTVLADNPSLCSHAVPGFEAVRVTLDARGRIPRHFRLFDGSMRTLVGVSARTPPERLAFLAERGVEAVPAGEERDGRIDLASFLAALEERGLSSIVCEGGGQLNRSLLNAGLVDRIHLVVAPLVLEPRSVNLFEGLGDPARLRLESCERQGDYVWLEYAVR